MERAFYKAQEEGGIPPDQPFMWFSVFSHDPFIHARLYIQTLYKAGSCLKPFPEITIYPDGENYIAAALSVVQLDHEKYIVGYAQCQSVNFSAVPVAELSKELATQNATAMTRKFVAGGFTGYEQKKLSSGNNACKINSRHNLSLYRTR